MSTLWIPQEGGGGGGSGTVTSVQASGGLTGFSFSGGPVTSAGTLTLGGVLNIAHGGTGGLNQQQALNNLTNGAGASEGDVLQYLSGNAQFAPFTAAPPTGSAGTFAYFNPLGDLDSIPNWTLSASPIQSAMNADLTYNPNNLAADPAAHNFSLNITPLQASPNDSFDLLVLSANLDATANGFDFGSSGKAANLLRGGYNYAGNGSVYGTLAYLSLSSTIGNGTDPVTIKGFNYIEGFLNVSANATFDGGLQGYGFQPALDAASVTTSNFGVTPFFDYGNYPVTVYGYTSFASTPIISEIANAHNYNGVNINPTITTMTGNAGMVGYSCNGAITTGGTGGIQGFYFNTALTTQAANAGMVGMYIGGQLTTMGASGNYAGVNVNPTITTSHGTVNLFQGSPNVAGGDANVTLFQGSMAQVTTSGATSVLDLNGQTATGADSQASINGVSFNVNGTMTAVSAQTIQTKHVLFTQFSIPDSTAITGTDCLMNVFSPDVDFGDATSSLAIGPAGLGSAMVGFAGQMHGHGQMDLFSAVIPTGIFAEDFTLGEWRSVNCNLINAGYTGTCTSATAFYHEVSGGGLFATTHWGLKVATAGVQNYVPMLAINTADQKVLADSLLGLGDQSLLSGDIHANIRNVRAKTDPSGYAVDAGYGSINTATFTDNSATAIVGAHLTTKVIVASTKAIGGMVGVFNPIGRADAGDDGSVPLALGYHTSFSSGNSATKTTSLFASYFTGFHSIDANANQVTAMYDFYAQASSIAAGAVTTRYGIVIEADANYTKQNWLSGQTVVGGSSATPTNASVGLEVAGTTQALLVSRLTTAEKNALTAVNGMIVYDTDLDKFQGYEAGAWTNLI